jgi:hypothetical protein
MKQHTVSFETKVKLMTHRKGEETLIEPHVFLKSGVGG